MTYTPTRKNLPNAANPKLICYFNRPTDVPGVGVDRTVISLKKRPVPLPPELASMSNSGKTTAKVGL